MLLNMINKPVKIPSKETEKYKKTAKNMLKILNALD